MQEKTLWTWRDWVDWYKSTSARSVLRGLGHRSDAVPTKRHLQAPALSIGRGVAEQVIPYAVPSGPQGWEMKLFEHLSVRRHSSEYMKCVCQSWRAYGTQVFAPDKKSGQVLWERGSLKRRSQDSISFLKWFIALKNRIWTVFSTEDQIPLAKRGPQEQFQVPRTWEQRQQWIKLIFLGPSKLGLKQLLEMRDQPVPSPERIR